MSQRIADTFDKRASMVKKTVIKHNGVIPEDAADDSASGLLSAEAVRTNLLLDMKPAVQQVDALRTGSTDRRCVDADLGFFVKEKFGLSSVEAFYGVLGVNPAYHTMESLASMPDFDEGFRWVRPEIFREAIRLGMRRSPIYPDLIAASETISQRSITMPSINMSDATPETVNEAETIPVGSVSLGERTVKVKKIGTGLKISDEVQKYVPLNILSIYLQDAGVKLGLGLDTMAISTLINGDEVGGGMSAPVIGVNNTTDGITYFDLLRAWIRLGRLGRTPSGMLSDELAALKILQFTQFAGGQYITTKQTINVRTPIPQTQDYFIHGAMPDTEIVGLIDKSSALIQLTASALKVESERIAERQVNGTYATITTGFAKLYRDAFLMINGALLFSGNGFPTYMDVNAAENITIY